MVIFSKKDISVGFYTLAEMLSKIFRNIRRKIGDLIYDHELTLINDFYLTYFFY